MFLWSSATAIPLLGKYLRQNLHLQFRSRGNVFQMYCFGNSTLRGMFSQSSASTIPLWGNVFEKFCVCNSTLGDNPPHVNITTPPIPITLEKDFLKDEPIGIIWHCQADHQTSGVPPMSWSRQGGPWDHWPQVNCRGMTCLFCCFTSQVNSYGHCGTVSSPDHTFFLGRLEQAVNQ